MNDKRNVATRFLVVAIEVTLRDNGITNGIKDIPVSRLAELLNAINLSDKYDAIEMNAISEAIDLDNDGLLKDGYGINPLVNKLERARFEYGVSLIGLNGQNIVDENTDINPTDTDAIRLVSQYYMIESKLNELREKITKLFDEDIYKAKINELNDDCDNIVEVIKRYYETANREDD